MNVVSPVSEDAEWFWGREFDKKKTGPFVISNCPKDSYLLINRGLDNKKETLPVESVLFEGAPNKIRYCQPELTSLRSSNNKGALDRIQNKWSHLNYCLYYEMNSNKAVIDRILQETENQQYGLDGKIYCRLNRKDENTIQIYPDHYGLCYFAVTNNEQYFWEPKWKKECKSKDFFRNNSIEFQELEASISFEQLSSRNLQSSDNSPIRVLSLITHINPSINQSESSIQKAPVTRSPNQNINPRFLKIWPVDVGIKNLKLQRRKYNNKVQSLVQSDWLVRNQCSSVCDDGLCTSPCNYSQPVIAKVSLYEESYDYQWVRLASWYDGNVAPAHWSGKIRNRGFAIDRELHEGRKYRFEVSFSKPTSSYRRAKAFYNQNRAFFIDTNVLDLAGGFSEVGSIPALDSIDAIDSFQSLEALDPENWDLSFIGINARRFWPPQYYWVQSAFLRRIPYQGQMFNPLSPLSSAEENTDILLQIDFEVKANSSSYEILNAKSRKYTSIAQPDECEGRGGIFTTNENQSQFLCEWNFNTTQTQNQCTTFRRGE